MKLAEALKNKIIEWGREIKRETKIIEVIADKCLVRDQNDVTYQYDNLIWAADLKTLYKIVKIEGLLPKIRSKFDHAKKIC